MVSYLILAEYLDTTKPVVSVNRVRQERPPLLNFTEHKAGTFFMFFDGKKILTVEESKRFVTFLTKATRTSIKAGVKVDEVFQNPMVPCGQLSGEISQGLLSDGLATVDNPEQVLDSILCGDLDPHLSYTEGTKFKLPFMRTKARIYPCSLPDMTQCASPQELSQLQIWVIYLTKIAKYKEKKEPFQTATDADTTFYIDISSKTEIQTFMKMNYIYDDEIGVVGERLTHKFIDVDKTKTVIGSRITQSVYCSTQQIYGGLCEPYIELVTLPSYEEMVIQRRYKRLFDVISEIGGFNDLIIYSLWAFYFLYNAYSYKKMIRSQVLARLSQFRGVKRRSPTAPGTTSKCREKPKESSKPMNSMTGDLPDLKFVREINSKSKVLKQAIFDSNPIFNFFLPKIIFEKKIKEKIVKNNQIFKKIQAI